MWNKATSFTCKIPTPWTKKVNYMTNKVSEHVFVARIHEEPCPFIIIIIIIIIGWYFEENLNLAYYNDILKHF
jgi:hypothetical protein